MKNFLKGFGIAALVLVIGVATVIFLHPDIEIGAVSTDFELGAAHGVAFPAPPAITTGPPEETTPTYIPQPTEITVHEFLHKNPFPERFVADNGDLPWYLTLVNRCNFLNYDFAPVVAHVGGGHYFDERAAQSLVEMMDAARDYGLSPLIVSSTRTVARQRYLFDRQVNRQISAGLSAEDAFEQARRVVAYPGSSEHNLGLAVDIVSYAHRGLTAAFGQTPEGIWLAQNGHYFGFVVRYQDHKQHITNIIYEPWHFRYVGISAATFMFENDLTLEEYVFWRLNS